MEIVKFNHLTRFTGRNGYCLCSGVDILDLQHSDEILLTARSSKNKPGRCDISIPREDIPEIIEKLSKFIK